MLALHNRLAGLERDYRYRPQPPWRPARQRRVSANDDPRRHRLSAALDLARPRRAARHLVAVAADPAEPASRGVPADAAAQGAEDDGGDSGPQPLVAHRAPNAARGSDRAGAGAPGAQPRPAELCRHRTSRPRRRQWLGLGGPLAGAARGDRRGDRPRRARRQDRRAGAVRARRSAHRSASRRSRRANAPPDLVPSLTRPTARRSPPRSSTSSAARRTTACCGSPTASTMARDRTSPQGLAKLAGASGSLVTLRPERDDAALALDQATGERQRACRARVERHEGPRSGVVKALTGRGEPLGEAPFTLSARRARGQSAFRSAARDPQSGRAASRSPASGRPAPCIFSTAARSGAGSASSLANRARPPSRCSRRSIMCSARSRLTPTSSRRTRPMSPTPCTS